MSQRSRDGNELIVSYMFLRQTIGWIGTLLPIVLLAGNAISSSAPRPDSISGYYYTDMRNVLVGTLCALGVFLVAYQGYDDVDRSITNVAGLAAIGVAFCPTKPAVCTAGAGACPASSVPQLSASQQMAGDFHLVFAAIAFIALGLMALRFAKRGETPGGQSLLGQLRYGLGFGQPSGGSQQHNTAENIVYHTTGLTILGCVLLAALSNLLPASVKAHWPTLFVFEALAVFAFGVSWFVKGKTIRAIQARIRKARHLPPAGTPDPGTERSPVTSSVL
ncbi:MAG TPA: hypothetical protein VME19_19455 [Streptosporangiaceae bacterium]|nr:hypothetical protein [Streptosporangiaceae bacterium]